jgi:predicted nucleotidyltransferase
MSAERVVPVPSPHAPSKRGTAFDVARTLAACEHVHLILLTGSVARGIESRDSDVDLAVFTSADADASFIQTQQIDGTLAEANFYSIDRVAKGPATPLLTLQDLREIGRFSTGEVLYSRWEHLEQARTAWLKALLDPEEAAPLFSLSASYLDPAGPDAAASQADRVWMLQGAAAALSILGVSLFPMRFQKPKWLIHDLKEARLAQLLDVLRSLHSGSGLNQERTDQLLHTVEEKLLAGLKLGGLPPLVKTESMDDDYFYLYRTFRDAISLRNDGDFEGAAFTAIYTIRLLNAALQAPARSPRISGGSVDAWRRTTVELLYPAGGLPDLQRMSHSLLQCGQELEQEYKRRFRESAPFESFSEGSWRIAHRSSSIRRSSPGPSSVPRFARQ